jgi:hypothetical protein
MLRSVAELSLGSNIGLGCPESERSYCNSSVSRVSEIGVDQR